MAQETVPACGTADYNTPSPDDDPAEHHLFTVTPPVYIEGKKTPKVYGVNIDVVIDEKGRVTCATPGSLDGVETPQRNALFAQAASWRYSPFTLDGKPARVWIRERIAEEIRPARHIVMPSAPLSRISIRYSVAGLSLIMRGDGTATALTHGEDRRTTRRDYRIDPGEFAALVERMRAADAWSMGPAYVRHLPDEVGVATLRIDIGGNVKTIVVNHPEMAGMPAAMCRFIDKVWNMERIDEAFPPPSDLPGPPGPLEIIPPEPVQAPPTVSE